ncbi:hypothetical protein ROHU_035005 [Labeo rohita]|uniref:Uncharacterized protein n=1 Tax=Labeo rohita TaxID=84645 RepID=A0A498L2J2_LABRO|nr:hypothetical protein ROHU_035005 [Labeo rohita]
MIRRGAADGTRRPPQRRLHVKYFGFVAFVRESAAMATVGGVSGAGGADDYWAAADGRHSPQPIRDAPGGAEEEAESSAHCVQATPTTPRQTDDEDLA